MKTFEAVFVYITATLVILEMRIIKDKLQKNKYIALSTKANTCSDNKNMLKYMYTT